MFFENRLLVEQSRKGESHARHVHFRHPCANAVRHCVWPYGQRVGYVCFSAYSHAVVFAPFDLEQAGSFIPGLSPNFSHTK